MALGRREHWLVQQRLRAQLHVVAEVAGMTWIPELLVDVSRCRIGLGSRQGNQLQLPGWVSQLPSSQVEVASEEGGLVAHERRERFAQFLW